MLVELGVRINQAERDAKTIRFEDARIEIITFELGGCCRERPSPMSND